MQLIVDSNPPSHKLNDEIQALRAVAVTFVLFHHFQGLFFWGNPQFYQKVEGLWTGVDLFFVISGYVIATSLLEKIQLKTGPEFWAEAGAFWIRRAYRILPSAWLWLFLTLIATAFANKSGAFGVMSNNLADTISSVLQVANIHFFQCANGKSINCGSLAIYWTLSLEEQFYILLPILIFVFRARLSIALAGLVLSQVFIERHQWGGILSFLRTDAIMLGVLLAIFSKSSIYKLFKPTILQKKRYSIFVLFLLFSISYISTTKIVPFYMGLVSLISVILVWIASYNKGFLINNASTKRLLALMGERSFSIYLIHMPAFWLTHEIWYRIMAPNTIFDSSYSLRFLGTAAVILVGLVELNFRLVEGPWRNRGMVASKQFIDRRIQINGLASTVLVSDVNGAGVIQSSTDLSV